MRKNSNKIGFCEYFTSRSLKVTTFPVDFGRFNLKIPQNKMFAKYLVLLIHQLKLIQSFGN